jgi:hypothetical protein
VATTQNKMKKTMTIFGAILFASFILASCNSSEKSKSSMTGKWMLKSAMGIESQDGDNTYILLNDDNTAIEKNKFGEYKRTWSIKGDSLCLKTIEEDGGIESCGTYKLDGDKLVWNLMDVEMIYEK